MYELEIRISDFGPKTLKTEDDFIKFFKLCEKKYPEIDYSGIASLGLEIKYIRKIKTKEILKDIENMLDIFKILAENSLLFKGEMKGVIYANALTKIYF